MRADQDDLRAVPLGQSVQCAGQSGLCRCPAQARVRTRDVTGAGVHPIRNHEAIPANPLAWGWVVDLDCRAGSDRSGRPPSSTTPGRWRLMSSETEIRPFRVDMPDEAIADLRRRIAATRWPSQGARRRPVAGRAAGDDPGARPLLGGRLRLARVRGEAERAAAVHDRDRRGGHPLHPREVAARGRVAADHDARLARLGHRAARGDRPADRPGRARRASAEDAFDLVLPSLPGYGFSGEPAEVGWDPGRVAQAWAELMRRLGYTRYVAQGGDVGASVTDAMGRQAPEGLAGIHMNLLVTALGGGAMPAETEQERAALEQTRHSGRAASATSWSRPRGRRRSATPCWIHPSPWRPGCSTTTPTPTTRSPAPSSAGSRPGISPGTTSSTTSRCTG